eukprot:6478360-Amphidinium_carterae.2
MSLDMYAGLRSAKKVQKIMITRRSVTRTNLTSFVFGVFWALTGIDVCQGRVDRSLVKQAVNRKQELEEEQQQKDGWQARSTYASIRRTTI